MIALCYNIHTNTGETKMNILFTYRNLAIAVVVVFVAIIGYYVLTPKATVTPAAKPAVSAPAAPVKK
jgi:hypothetical protein